MKNPPILVSSAKYFSSLPQLPYKLPSFPPSSTSSADPPFPLPPGSPYPSLSPAPFPAISHSARRSFPAQLPPVFFPSPSSTYASPRSCYPLTSKTPPFPPDHSGFLLPVLKSRSANYNRFAYCIFNPCSMNAQPSEPLRYRTSHVHSTALCPLLSIFLQQHTSQRPADTFRSTEIVATRHTSILSFTSAYSLIFFYSLAFSILMSLVRSVSLCTMDSKPPFSSIAAISTSTVPKPAPPSHSLR